MSKLMPPIIAGILPAFYGNELTVPFTMNRAVSKNEVKSFEVKIKNIQNSKYIANYNSTNIDWNNGIVTFNISGDLFRVGQHYKIQIAYKKGNDVGFYSDAASAKYTTKPTVEIVGLDFNKNNFHQYSYTGRYAQYHLNVDKKNTADTSEKLYSYRFDLYDKDYNLVLTSGEKIHNSTNDDEVYESLDTFVITQDLEKDKKYYLQFVVTTINNMIVPSEFYPLLQKSSINPEWNFEIIAELDDRETGAAAVYLKPYIDEETGLEKTTTGAFKLLRSGSNTNYTEWNELLNFNLYNQVPLQTLYTDYTIEHGIGYKYAVVQCSQHNLWSNRLESNIVRPDFEFAYLYDGKRQLKIKFNPKVASFKETLLESKVDTIGSKHPFIFRNGNVGYKEFSISGLISLQMDEENLFTKRYLPLKEERKYRYQYQLVDVVGNEVYHYSKVQNKLYVLSGAKYFLLTNYMHANNISADRVYELVQQKKLIFCFKNEDGTYKTNIEVTKEKKYSFPVDKNSLFILQNGVYIPATGGYNRNQKYYIQYTIPDNNNDIIDFRTYSVNNVQAEREFKLKVLDWLNNGQPKLFRSPTEGNYIIRLMNVSLSPNDTLGRLLHTFTATAYEIAENNFNSIQSLGLIDNNNIDNQILAWETIDIHKRLYEENKTNLLNYKAVSLRLEGLLPGDKLTLNDGRTIVIGATGAYNLELDSGIEITSITFTPQNDNITVRHQGTLTYAYYRTTMNKFDTIKDINIIDVPIKQMQGPCYNLVAQFNDIKHQLQKIHFIHAKQIDFNNTNLQDNLLTINGSPISLIEIKEYDMKNIDTFDITFGSNIQLEICYQINEIVYDIEPSLSEYINYHIELDKLSNAIYHETTSTPPVDVINQQKIVQEKYNDFIKALETKLREQEAIEGEAVQ